jgi:subtilase family serine protease
MPHWPRAVILFALLLLLSACGSGSQSKASTPTPAVAHTPLPASARTDFCPSFLRKNPNCYTPHALRVAYGIESLTEQGYAGKGQTVVDIVSYGSPFLQQDMDVYDRQFDLPPVNLRVIAPLGTVPFDPKNQEMVGWAQETELDVQIIHSIAPDASIVVMTSPVDETEGTIGLPEFLKLEQYAVEHHLGHIFSQSYVASEVTLADQKGRQLVKTYTDFYRQITTQQGWTVLSGSGDHGATDFADIAATKLSSTPTVNFPADVPWVTAVGGTSLHHVGSGYNESAWPESGGGVSQFFSEPDFQRGLPPATQSLLAGHRGLPDIAGDADPFTGLAFYFAGQWSMAGGTSASTPLWAGIVAIANQVAGRPLGFINPALYKIAQQDGSQAFRDITTGRNGLTDPKIQGYSAGPGWDAVTGWGAPQAKQLIPDLIAALK